MTFLQWIKDKIFKFKKVDRLAGNPEGPRFTFINDDEKIKLWEVRENKVWFIGSDAEILNFYTQRDSVGFADNPIYDRNNMNYFWAKAAQEVKIKRVHSPICHNIVSTICNIVGMPQIDITIKSNKQPDEQEQTEVQVNPLNEVWEKIAEENDFANKLTQQARPMTCATGYGAWKINFNKELCDVPLWEHYDAEFVKYIYESGVLFGIIFKTFYKDKDNKNYVLFETRYRKNKNSYIEYSFCKLEKGDEITELSLEKAKELFNINVQNQCIKGLDKILAVPTRYFYDPLKPEYGRSIYQGKIGLFDFYDEIWSQASQTNRVSTPVEYYSTDVLQRGPNGEIALPSLYNRQFVAKEGIPNGDGTTDNDVLTTQPDLNFDKYATLAVEVLNNILTGVLSPATLGLDLAKKDNADAQREKEKVTIQTRNNIIVKETKEIREIVTLSLLIQDYMKNDEIHLIDYDIQVNYNEFANPSFENELQILGQAWSAGEISTEKYVNLLWTDKLTQEEKKKEAEWLDSHREQYDMENMLNGNGEPTQPDLFGSEE